MSALPGGGSGAVPQMIWVQQRAVNSQVVTELVDCTFDVLPSSVHRQQRIACRHRLGSPAADDDITLRDRVTRS